MLNNLSKKNLRINKRKTYLSLITITLAALLLTSAGVIPLNIYKDYRYKTQQESGKYQIAINNLSKENADKISSEGLIEESGKSCIYGFKQDEKFSLLYYDDFALEMSAFRLLEGKMPIADNEIALDEYYLESHNIKKELNTTIHLEYIDTLGEINKREFKLSGIISTTSQARVKEIYYGFISKTILDSLSEDNINWSVYANTSFNKVDQIENYMNEIRDNYGINNDQCVINDSFINSNKVDFNLIISVLTVILVIIVATFVVIYSIFYVSINEKVSEYGKLRALGVTKRQIKKMIFSEGFYLSIVGIPIGVILGYILSNIISFNFLFKETPYDSKGSLLIIVISIILSLITIAISLIKPAKVAMKISPINAITYNPTLIKEGKSRKSEKNISVRKLTLLNIKRYKKRSMMTIASISISVMLFIVIGTVLNSFNMEKATRQYISGDFELSTVRDTENYKYGSFNESLLNNIKNLNGITEINKVSLVNTSYKNEGNLKITTNDSMLEGVEEIPSILFGYDENMINLLQESVIEGSIDVNNLRTKNEIIIFRELNDHRFNTKVNDIIKININDGENEFEESFKVQAIVDRSDMESVDVISLGEPFLIHNELLNNITNKDCTIKLQIKCNENTDGINKILSQLVNNNSNIKLKSFIETKKELESDFMGFKIVGFSLVIVIAIISLVNYINTILASVISRKREFGILQAIGVSNKQLFSILNFEGWFYLCISTLIAVVIGSTLGYLIVKLIENKAVFVNYKYPIILVAGIILVVVIIQISISKILINGIQKDSLISRINNVGD